MFSPAVLIPDCQCDWGHPDSRFSLTEAGGAGLGWGGSTCFQTRFFPAPASERCPHPTVVSIVLELAVSLCVPGPWDLFCESPSVPCHSRCRGGGTLRYIRILNVLWWKRSEIAYTMEIAVGSNGEGLGGRTQRFSLWSLFLCSLSIVAGSAVSVTWRRTCGWTWLTEPSSVVGATSMAVVATTTQSSTTEKLATRWLWNWEQSLLMGLVRRGILLGWGCQAPLRPMQISCRYQGGVGHLVTWNMQCHIIMNFATLTCFLCEAKNELIKEPCLPPPLSCDWE